MKRKPMLLKRIKKERNQPREIIGFVGTHHGVGVTFTSLMMAFYLGEFCDKKVALIEYNSSKDMSRVEEVYQWTKLNEVSFSFHNITCYKNTRHQQFAELLNRPYDCYILDFGTDCNTFRDDFLLCNKKFIIGDKSEWNQKKLKDFIANIQYSTDTKRWTYLIPYATPEVITGIRKEIGARVYAIPFEKEATVLKKGTVKLLSNLLGR